MLTSERGPRLLSRLIYPSLSNCLSSCAATRQPASREPSSFCNSSIRALRLLPLAAVSPPTTVSALSPFARRAAAPVSLRRTRELTPSPIARATDRRASPASATLTQPTEKAHTFVSRLHSIVYPTLISVPPSGSLLSALSALELFPPSERASFPLFFFSGFVLFFFMISSTAVS